MKQRQRRQINPQTIKKHSDLVSAASHNVFVRGDREKTPTGYRVTGFRGKSFETQYEVMLPGTSTDLVRHEKKDRTVRILSGDGFIITGQGNESKIKRLMPGDEICLERGTPYRITTAAKIPVEMVVCQQAKYELNLEVLEEVGAAKEVPAEMLEEPSVNVRLASAGRDFENRRRGSRAIEQSIEAANSRPTGQTISSQSQLTGPVQLPESAGVAAGVNVRPSGGNFDPSGAG